MSDLLNSASLVMIPSGYKEDVVYSQIPTDGSGDLAFTRASNGTRINSAGLVEVCPWNLAQYSEDFSNAAWTKAGASITANDTTAPNGTTTADKILASAVNSEHGMYNATPYASNFVGEVYTYSVYAKKGTVDWLIVDHYQGTYTFTWFNLNTGTLGTVASGVTATIESVGNGWYRCSCTKAITSTSVNYIGIYLSNANNTWSFNASGSEYIYAWGAQVNIGSTAKPYFPTTDRLNVPRLTYQNGGGGCPSLLLEKQSTNQFTYSEQFDNSGWTKTNTSVTANSAISPDGTQNADTVANTGTNNTPELFQLYSGASSSTAYTFSCYMKANTHTKGVLRAYNGGSTTTPLVLFDLSAGTVIASYGNATNATITSIGNGWYRCSMTFTTISATVGIYGHITNLSNTYTYQSSFNYVENYNNTGSIYIWGAQLEASSYATSYIPTTSSSATRVADVASKTGISSLIGQTQGTLFVDVDFKYNNETTDKDTRIWSIWDDSAIKIISIWARDNALRYQVYDAATSLNIENSITASQGRHKVALAYNGTSLILYMDGSLVINTTMAQNAPATSRAGLAYFWYQNAILHSVGINQALLFKTALTTTELASLTTL